MRQTRRTGPSAVPGPSASSRDSVAKSTSRRRDPALESIRVLAVTVEEAARMLSMSRASLYKLVMSGEVESFLIGKRTRRISVAVLEQIVAAGLPFGRRTV